MAIRRARAVAILAMLTLVSIPAGNAHGVTWDFEDPDGDGVYDDHGFTLRGLEEGELEDLPFAGSAWHIGKPNDFEGTEPIVDDPGVTNIDEDGLLSYCCNMPFPYDPDTESNDRGQDGYLDTYARTMWGDNLHTDTNDQIATSPAILLPENATMEVWSVGSDAQYFAPELEDNSRKPEDEVDGYFTGSSGVAVISEEDGSLLDSLLVASNGGSFDELDLSDHAGKVVRVEVVDAFAGGWGWLAIDEISIPGATLVGESIPGDFNDDGVLDLGDIDDLTAQSASGTNPPAYDLNADSVVDAADINIWIEDLFNSWNGDANLDKEFNSGDLVNVLASGTYETGVNAIWSTGDFDGDGLANSNDLVAALSGGGYEAGLRPVAAAVPEPASGVLSFVGLLVATLMLRRVPSR